MAKKSYGIDPVYVASIKQVSTLVLVSLQLSILPERKSEELKETVSKALYTSINDWAKNSFDYPFGIRQGSLHKPETEIKVGILWPCMASVRV